MFLVSTRVKGPQGALSLPDRGYRTEPTHKDLAELDASARQVYHETHGTQSYNMTVDLKVVKKLGSTTVSRNGQIVGQK